LHPENESGWTSPPFPFPPFNNFVFFFFALFVVLVVAFSKSHPRGGGGIAVARLKVNHFFKVVAFTRSKGRWREDDDACTIILPSVNIIEKKKKR
tara:strand:+ start:408 stop:692 length:285 start_codon:yes stop_codon:yes gene_type:complete